MAGRLLGENTLIIDHNPNAGKKLLITGGGNCNFSNKSVSFKDYRSQNIHFCKSALAGFKPSDFTALLDKHRIAWEEREKGEYFGFNAKDIVDMLTLECKNTGAEFLFNIKAFDIEKTENYFIIKTSSKDLHAKNVIIATGGLPMPKIGASSFAFDAAKKFGLNVVEPYPALCPFLWREKELKKFGTLTGLSCKAALTCGKVKIIDDLLFTHYGVSGPAALQMSLWTQGEEEIKINFLPLINLKELITLARQTNKTFLQFFQDYLPQRMLKTLLEGFDIQAANATKQTISDLENILTSYTFVPQKNNSYLKAEISGGGVDTKELSSSSMQSVKIQGLYFTGECIDVSGRLGGYNLHWAWASAAAAAKNS